MKNKIIPNTLGPYLFEPKVGANLKVRMNDSNMRIIYKQSILSPKIIYTNIDLSEDIHHIIPIEDPVRQFDESVSRALNLIEVRNIRVTSSEDMMEYDKYIKSGEIRYLGDEFDNAVTYIPENLDNNTILVIKAQHYDKIPGLNECKNPKIFVNIPGYDYVPGDKKYEYSEWIEGAEDINWLIRFIEDKIPEVKKLNIDSNNIDEIMENWDEGIDSVWEDIWNIRNKLTNYYIDHD